MDNLANYSAHPLQGDQHLRIKIKIQNVQTISGIPELFLIPFFIINSKSILLYISLIIFVEIYHKSDLNYFIFKICLHT